MSTLKNHLYVKDARYRKPKKTTPLVYTENLKVDDISILEFKNKYILETKLNVSFYASNDEYDLALEAARRAILDEVYGDILKALHMINVFAYNEDYESINKIVRELSKEILDD